MAYADTMPVPFEIGRVVRRMSDIFSRRWQVLGLLTILFVLLPSFAYALLTQYQWAQLERDPFAMFASAKLIGIWLVVIILSFLGQAALVNIATSDQLGESPRLGTSVTAGAAMLLPLIGLKIVTWVSIWAASVLLFIPGLMLFTRWFVALPALLAERDGVLDSLGRSRDLTDGVRWRIFGLIAVLGVFYLIALGVLRPMQIMLVTGGPMIFVAAGMQAVVGALTSIVWAVVLVATYAELREVKEGGVSSQLAEVFA